MSKSDFGLIGLAVMGQNLVLNVESRGFQVSVYNRTTAVTDDFVAAHPDKKLVGSKSLEEFVQSLASPRKVMIMVKAGGPVDAVIEQLIPLLDQGDIIIDGGNSLYTDTERRDKWLGDLGFRFIGAGVSGGEEGARKGPAIMPGGPASTWDVMKPIFETIAAKVDGEPCVVHIGPGGAGHYVKMIHNGIEYGDMQLICEAYNIFKAAGFSADELGHRLHRLEPRRPRKLPHPDHRRDLQTERSGNRQAARRSHPRHRRPEGHRQVDDHERGGKRRGHLHHQRRRGSPHPVLDEGQTRRRQQGTRKARKPRSPPKKPQLVKKVHDALYASKIISYAQGLDLITTMSAEKGWNLDLSKIAAIWRGGCIIRARFLNRHHRRLPRRTPASAT